MDSTTKATIETIGEAGYLVDIGVDDANQYVVTAVAYRGCERFIVRGPDLYAVTVELATQVGIELEDG
jgi:hypothetical protein